MRDDVTKVMLIALLGCAQAGQFWILSDIRDRVSRLEDVRIIRGPR